MRSFVAGIAALALSACSAGQQAPVEPSPTSSQDASTTSVPATSPPGDLAEVVHVFDGDSLLVRVDDREVEVRLIGVNAPEGDECHGDAAHTTLEQMLTSGTLTLVTDGEEADQFGRALRYAYVDGLNVNLALIANGDAVALQTGHSAEDEFTRIGDAAYNSRLGMWAPDACGTEIPLPDLAIVDYRYNPAGRDEEAMNDEWVAIANQGTDDVELGGWMIRDESTQHRFAFPDGFVLGASEEVVVMTGCGEDRQRELHWCADDPVWSNGGDTVILQTPEGTVAARDRYAGDF